MQITNIHEAKTQFSKLIERVRDGEEIIIASRGKPVAKLVPYDPNKEPRQPAGSWKGKVRMSDDFDEWPI